MRAITSVVKLWAAVIAMALFSVMLLPGVANAEPVTLISVEGTTADEPDTFVDARVRLSNPVNSVVTVKFATSPDTAKPGQDFWGTFQTITFQPGEQIQTAPVWLINDNVGEATEAFNVRIFDVRTEANVVTGATHAKVYIRDDDQVPGPNPKVNIAGTTINEGADFVDVRIRLDNPADELATVKFATAPNTAKPGEDYYGTFQTIEFEPGQTVAIGRIQLVDDFVPERNENFKVRIWDGNNIDVRNGEAFVNINDND